MCDGSDFFFKETATTEIYTLSLHDALPISASSAAARCCEPSRPSCSATAAMCASLSWSCSRERSRSTWSRSSSRSEEHTSELQSRQYLVCRLLLEKKNYITLYLSNL